MKKITDERILAGKRKLNSNAFGWLMIGLWAIILYRQFVLQQPIEQYRDMYLLTVGVSLFTVINNIASGYYLMYRKKASRPRLMLAVGFVAAVIFIGIEISTAKSVLSLEVFMWALAKGGAFFAFWVLGQTILVRVSERQADKGIE